VAVAVCLLSFAICFVAARRSLLEGVVAVLVVGYVYGIARANIPHPLSHFLFDSGVLGLYAALWMRGLTPFERSKTRTLQRWLVFLIGWPVILFFLPVQDPLIQLVGLRGQALFLPFLIIGALLDGQQLFLLALAIAGLNLAVFCVAGAEWTLGLEPFFPHNAVTELIYRSRDLVGGAFRIPSTFANSASYANTMVLTIPVLLGAWVLARKQSWQSRVLLAAMVASALAVFLAASRTQAAILLAVGAAVTALGPLKGRYRLLWIVLIAAVAWIVINEPTMQRFRSLQDVNNDRNRVTASVNTHFFDLAAEYPLGNGLGGGGTSLPYFLISRVHNRVLMENEYARIMLEQGIPGLCLWLAFIAWFVTRPIGRSSEPWHAGRWVARITCLAGFAASSIGTGLLTTIPATPIFLMLAGWTAAPQSTAVRVARTTAARNPRMTVAARTHRLSLYR
jgi:hypothetical protein